jgi:lipid II isoglutaminyl synthase (glutamine-hydrolysing)
MSTGSSTLAIVHLYPTVLGLYGDRGNALVLAARAASRDIACEIISVQPGDPVPAQGDIYLLGGGEDLAQSTAVELLRDDGNLAAVFARDGVVLAVCAGLQILGHSFGEPGATRAGLGLIDCVTLAGGSRAVGEVVAQSAVFDLPTLTGYENHQGRTTLGAAVQPLGQVTRGVGNGDGTEGFVQGRAIGTYMHGPVLARNPALADRLLGWAVGAPLAALDDTTVEALREERLGSNAQVAPQRRRWLRRR